MIFYIIIGHRSNKIQSLLDIDEFFSFFFKKTQIYFYIYFSEIFSRAFLLCYESVQFLTPAKQLAAVSLYT
jgi:hypothetical protein